MYSFTFNWIYYFRYRITTLESCEEQVALFNFNLVCLMTCVVYKQTKICFSTQMISIKNISLIESEVFYAKEG